MDSRPQRRNRKKGKLRRTKSNGAQSENAINDPNADITVPKTKEQKEQELKLKLRQQLVEESQSKWSQKKKKRLDKYIDKKLQKEERVQILQKLAQSQAEVTTSLDLQSSSTLGTGRPTTTRQLRDQQEDREVRHAIEGRPTPTGSKRKRRGQDSFAVHSAEGSSEEDDDSEIGNSQPSGLSAWNPIVIKELPPAAHDVDTPSTTSSSSAPAISAPKVVQAPALGSALKRNDDGTMAAPKLRFKSDKKAIARKWQRNPRQGPSKAATAEVNSESSFDSSDSANDSSEGEEDAASEDSSLASDEEEDDDEDEDDSDEEMDEIPEESEQSKRKSFKDWAKSQLLASQGHDETTSERPPPPTITNARPLKKQKTAHSGPTAMRGPLGEDVDISKTPLSHQLSQGGSSKVKFVSVQRPQDVEDTRILLPIVAEEQPIMEALLLNPVVVLCGETGSGKTTQVPQFLYEAGFGHPDSENPGMIGVTQPRRVAAMAMANRVAHELSLTSSRVSYQIRYDATVSSTTSIKFMTDGVLLRELATDFLLTKYSVIIIDEAHERSMNTDILIGVLSRVVKLREEMWKEGKDNTKPLRLIIMSATLRVGDFAENKSLFSIPPPIINVAARQFPVTVHFNRRTCTDYVTEAVKKASKIHSRLPPGGILIFLTGQNEITGVCRKLEAKYGVKALQKRKESRSRGVPQASAFMEEDYGSSAPVAAKQADIEPEDLDFGSTAELLAADVDDGMAEEDPDALDSDDDELDQELGIHLEEEVDTPMHILPLYSLLPSEKQALVFKDPPEGSRLVIVATNVAETSLTIPGIRYVVDCGRAKERRYDIASGIQSFQVSWISKASAQQRAGRAGRTGPGHCYRLYSSALYENYFDQFSQPEILRMPIEGVVLQMKSMHIDSILNFPFPTSPDRFSLKKAEEILTNLGALTTSSSWLASRNLDAHKITELGRSMSFFPLSPRFARMLVSGQQRECLSYVVALVSALSVGDPFLREEAIGIAGAEDDDELDVTSGGSKEVRRQLRRDFFKMQHIHSSLGSYMSDDIRILSVVGAYEYAGGGLQFCKEHFVNPKSMEEIHKLRAQISGIITANFLGMDPGLNGSFRPPSEMQLKILRQLLCAAYIDQVAVRKDRVDSNSSSRGTQSTTSKGIAYKAVGVSEDVFIHPSSILYGRPPPEYIVYREVVRTSQVWLKGLTVVNPAWLSSLGKSTLCTFSKPMPNNKGVLMVIPRFGPEGWELPPVKAETVQ